MLQDRMIGEAKARGG